MSTSQVSARKQQGVIEAARDDRSFVTAADAEREMLEESKRAGSDAYQFDPNATPEQKAAQARSVSAVVWRCRTHEE